MLTLLFQLLAELFISRPPGLEPGTQSTHAQRALAELDSRFFRIKLSSSPNTELGKLNRTVQFGKSRARELVQPSTASKAIDDSFEWSCK
jgi:hypothetical protein